CASHLVISGKSATFSTAFSKLGLFTDGGLSYTLPQRIGSLKATQLLLTSEKLSSGDAHSIGLIDQVHEDGTALEVALRQAHSLAQLSPLVVINLLKTLASQ